MPLKITEAVIANIECDAVVNQIREDFQPNLEVGAVIHRIDCLEVGQTKLTHGYNSLCKYIIHTVVPCWKGGNHNERELLQSCYKQALGLAIEAKCGSISLPLLSSGEAGYPKDKVIEDALEVIKKFLYENDMLVYLVINDKSLYELSEQLNSNVSSYIKDNLIRLSRSPKIRHLYDELLDDSLGEQPSRSNTEYCFDEFKEKFICKGFRDKLFGFIDKKHCNDVDCYKRANVSRQTWHKIVSDNYYHPTKNTAIALAISLQLDMDETQELLETAGFILSKSSLSDLIIMFCIGNKIYDVFEIDSILFKYGEDTLFSKE